MSRPALLLFPGLQCDARLWREQVAALAGQADIHVADISRDDDLTAMAARALAVMPRHFAVAGLSMGGYAALALLRLAPGRVTRLCLMDTSARPDSPMQARRRRGLMALVRAGSFQHAPIRLQPGLLHPDNLADAILCAELRQMIGRIGREVLLRQHGAILARPDSRPMLPHLRLPTLVLVGARDGITPPELATEIAEAVPGARLHVLPGSGHLPPMEQPDLVSALLRDWLTG